MGLAKVGDIRIGFCRAVSVPAATIGAVRLVVPILATSSSAAALPS